MNPNTITLILAIATVVSPVVFGYALWQMSKIFVSRDSFAEYKLHAESERTEMKDRLTEIENNTGELAKGVATLLERTK